MEGRWFNNTRKPTARLASRTVLKVCALRLDRRLSPLASPVPRPVPPQTRQFAPVLRSIPSPSQAAHRTSSTLRTAEISLALGDRACLPPRRRPPARTPPPILRYFLLGPRRSTVSAKHSKEMTHGPKSAGMCTSVPCNSTVPGWTWLRRDCTLYRDRAPRRADVRHSDSALKVPNRRHDVPLRSHNPHVLWADTGPTDAMSSSSTTTDDARRAACFICPTRRSAAASSPRRAPPRSGPWRR
jgi:hypothetical protein